MLAFPCNQFGSQEPGTLAEIRAFAKEQYHVTFAVFPKIEVNGPNQHPIFAFLKQNLPGQSSTELLLGWNFEKILVGRQGMPVKHFPSSFEQQELERAIEIELGKSSVDQATSS